MAAGGNNPKMNRQRRGAPVRGDWVRLDPMPTPVIPTIDELDEPVEGWHVRSKLLWESWRNDPVTALWTGSDLAIAVETIYLHSEAAMGGRGAPPAEIRLRYEGLGIGAEGRAKRRYLLPDEPEPEEDGDSADSATGDSPTADNRPEAV